MKALIRNAGETVLEDSGIVGIDWTTGAPLTNESWCGGAYALADECPPDAEPSDFDITEEQVPDASAPAEEDGTAEVPAIIRRVATFNAERYEARKAEQASEPEPIPDPTPEASEEGAPTEEPAPAAEPQEAPSDDDEIVVIDGVEYTKAQIRAMMEGSQ